MAIATNPTVKVERNGAVATLTLNRPRQRNALSLQLMHELLTLLDELHSDPAVRLVDDWSNREWRWSPIPWRREVLAERVVSWIRHYDWLSASADSGFSAFCFISSTKASAILTLSFFSMISARARSLWSLSSRPKIALPCPNVR